MATKKPSKSPAPPRSFEGPKPGDPVAAMAALSTEMGEQFETIGNTVVKLTERIEINDTRAVKLSEEVADVAKKFAELKAGEQFAEFADRLDKDKEQIKRLNEGIAKAEKLLAMGGPAKPTGPQLPTAFAQEIATGAGMAEYRRMCEENKSKKVTHSFRVENSLAISRAHGFAGQSTVIVDSGLVGDGSDPVTQQGLTELIRDPIGLIDVINEVPGTPDVDAFREMVEDEVSSRGAVAAAANGAGTGGSSAVDAITVHNTEGFFVGQKIYVEATATGMEGPHTISAITPGTTLTFATAVIDFNIADGDLIVGEEFIATAENGFKPAGVLKASLQTVAIQTLATYLIMTRQRLLRTNLFDLMGWAAARLPARLRESLEWALLYGSGTEPQLHGFLNTTLMTTHSVATDTWNVDLETGSNRADLILWSAANIPGDRPIVCVMHKLDWFKLTSAKNANNDYLHGQGEGPSIIDTPMLKAIGGVQVVLSSKIIQPYALVMDAAQASSFVRIADAELSVGWVESQFIKNQQTMLYEQSFAHLLKVGSAYRRAYMNQPPN